MLAAGADVNVADGAGRTPLAHACKEENAEIARALLVAGADLSMKDRDGKTPLDHASPEFRARLMVDLLLGSQEKGQIGVSL